MEIFIFRNVTLITTIYLETTIYSVNLKYAKMKVPKYFTIQIVLNIIL